MGRWNCLVTKCLSENHEDPTFKEFAAFVLTEAEIACNPVTSFHGLHAAESVAEKANLRENKINKVRVLTTQTNIESRKVNKILCMLYQKDKHQLNDCFNFLSKPLEERWKCFQENMLCYECLNSGHSTKEYHNHLTCNTKIKHQTSLHDDNFVKTIKTLSSAVQTQSDPDGTINAVSLNVSGEE